MFFSREEMQYRWAIHISQCQDDFKPIWQAFVDLEKQLDKDYDSMIDLDQQYVAAYEFIENSSKKIITKFYTNNQDLDIKEPLLKLIIDHETTILTNCALNLVKNKQYRSILVAANALLTEKVKMDEMSVAKAIVAAEPPLLINDIHVLRLEQGHHIVQHIIRNNFRSALHEFIDHKQADLLFDTLLRLTPLSVINPSNIHSHLSKLVHLPQESRIKELLNNNSFLIKNCAANMTHIQLMSQFTSSQFGFAICKYNKERMLEYMALQHRTDVDMCYHTCDALKNIDGYKELVNTVFEQEVTKHSSIQHSHSSKYVHFTPEQHTLAKYVEMCRDLSKSNKPSIEGEDETKANKELTKERFSLPDSKISWVDKVTNFHAEIEISPRNKSI